MTDLPVQIILGSSSPYRQTLLKRLGLPFDVVAPNIDESPQVDENPQQLSTRLARQKAQHIAALHSEAWVIGADQVGVLTYEGQSILLQKPGSFKPALKQLQQMRGRWVTFFSAVALVNAFSSTLLEAQVATKVKLRSDLSDDQLTNYLHIEQAYDCAGSAKIEGMGIVLVEALESEDPTALIGLPLIALSRLLRQSGIDVLSSQG